MAVPAHPNAAAFSNIQATFGGSNPISLSEYYAGGTYVRSGTGVHTPNGIPTSGAISVFDFMGGNNYFQDWSTTIGEADTTFIVAAKGAQESVWISGSQYSPAAGSWTDPTPNQGAMNGAYNLTSTQVTQVTPKGAASTQTASLNVRGPSGLSNDDLSAFKTFTWSGRGTFLRSDAGFGTGPNTGSAPGITSATYYNWNWSGLPASVYSPSITARTISLTNA